MQYLLESGTLGGKIYIGNFFHFNWFKWQLWEVTGAHYSLSFNLHP